MTVKLTALLIENFSGIFLSPMYDNPAPVAPFHRQAWELYCSEAELAAVAAPREHAKTTALTQNFGLAAVLFRFESHVMLVGSSEELAMGLLGDMTKQIKENDDLRAEFGISKFIVESKAEIIVKCDDGYEFRIIARGVEQRVRGIKWNGRRPGLILGDDVEEDEQVENAVRRRKLSKWINRALIPMGRKGCKVRFQGTILHDSSFLARAMKSKTWKTLFFRAHKSFDDFSEILWPEQFTETRLRAIRQRFIEEQDSAGYAQEYLNDPHDDAEAFLKKQWFRPMEAADHDSPKLIVVGVDFAVSKADKANRTSINVVGQDTSHNVHFLDVRVGRMDSEEIIDELFSVQDRWRPDVFFVESGQIWLAMWPTIRKEMLRTGRFINFEPLTPIKDKKARARPWQKRMKAGACYFDKEADWYPGYEEECLRFTGDSEATLDDQFDGSATALLGLEAMADVETEDFEEEDEVDMRRTDPRIHNGRSSVTGY